MHIYWLVFFDPYTKKEIKKVGTLNKKDLPKLIKEYKFLYEVKVTVETLPEDLGDSDE